MPPPQPLPSWQSSLKHVHLMSCPGQHEVWYCYLLPGACWLMWLPLAHQIGNSWYSARSHWQEPTSPPLIYSDFFHPLPHPLDVEE